MILLLSSRKYRIRSGLSGNGGYFNCGTQGCQNRGSSCTDEGTGICEQFYQHSEIRLLHDKGILSIDRQKDNAKDGEKIIRLYHLHFNYLL